jgi:hypothetical protein
VIPGKRLQIVTYQGASHATTLTPDRLDSRDDYGPSDDDARSVCDGAATVSGRHTVDVNSDRADGKRQRSSGPASNAARLDVIADHVGRYREDVGEVASTQDADANADFVIAAFEAERALRTAERLVRRAAVLAKRA